MIRYDQPGLCSLEQSEHETSSKNRQTLIFEDGSLSLSMAFHVQGWSNITSTFSGTCSCPGSFPQ